MNYVRNTLFPVSVVVLFYCLAWTLIGTPQDPDEPIAQSALSTPAKKGQLHLVDQSHNIPLGSVQRSSSHPLLPVGASANHSAAQKPTDQNSCTFDPEHDSKLRHKGSTTAHKPQHVHGVAEVDIPEICTGDLPGLDFANHQTALIEISEAIRRHKQQAKQKSEQQTESTSSAPNSKLPFSRDGRTTGQILTGQITGAKPQLDLVNHQKSFAPLPGHDSANQLANYNPHQEAAKNQSAAYLEAAANPDVDPHYEVFSRDAFPSATACKKCHEQIYREWSMSGHAYAAISPMFHKFEQRINDLSQGTIGYFCMRCHAPVATTMELRRDQPIWDGPRVFREGVTCVACHRVVQAHGKDNGERRIEPGGVNSPIVGSGSGLGVELAKKHADYFKVKTDPKDKRPGQVMHRRVIQFDQLSKSTFCVSCHQVAVEPGIALEVVWNQYRASPAWRKGITCQDCHMGRVPGMAEGYSVGPVAIIDGKQVTPDRKHSNHQFYGPGYSIAHPGIFPQNPEADQWTVNEWLQFDWRSGWGTEDFEEALESGQVVGFFPPVWSDPDDRMDAREIVDANLKLLGYKRDLRRQVMENGAKVEGPFFTDSALAGKPLKFYYRVKNTNIGHNMPSGSLGAQPQLWLNVVLIGPRGNRIWESGYLDSVGDLADLHSADVLARKVPLDAQLFNLQTKFLTTNVKGTDREMYLPVPFDNDQLPFLRPDTRPNSVMNHPPTIRMEGHSIAATGSRKAKYKVPAHLMVEPGCYKLSVRLRSRAEPVYFMKFVKSTPEMIRSMNEGILDVHCYSKTFYVR